MATEKQITANRKNALKGGVKTDAGKSTTRQNGMKHGFFSKIVTDFDKLAHEEFSEGIYNHFSPSNVYEAQLVEVILSNLLAYRRICLFESQLISNDIEKAVNGDEGLFIELGRSPYQDKFRTAITDEMMKIKRYKVCAFNLITKAHHELERAKAMENGKDIPIPEVCDINLNAQ